ncbi:MAG: trigger factor [Candidatus Cybelea sp.]
MTESTLTQLAPTLVALEFSLSETELAAAEERVFRRLARNVRLPGFRKGRVPRKIFEQTYGSETVTKEAVDEVIPDVYAQALREHDLEPVERPKLEVVESADGRPTRFKATVEVRPAIALGAYKGIVVSRPPVTVTEDEVERGLEALARERATLVPAEREAQLGDIATLDYEGTIDGVPFEGGRADGQAVELDEGRFIPGFAAGIAGMRPGETKQIEIRFPDDYHAAELSGKPATFRVSLRELKELELPALDDDFAKAVSENQTVAELRADLRRRLEAVAAGRSRRSLANTIVTQLLATHDFPLPGSLVEAELERLVADVGAEPVEAKTTDAQRRDVLRAEAESRVKAGLLIEAIAKAENVTATPGDIAAELDALGRRYGQPADRIRKALGNSLLSLMDGIVRNKTLDLLVDNAVITNDEETTRSAS